MRAEREPESYGTFSHLWASVAHESARSDAARRDDAAAAHAAAQARTRRRRGASPRAARVGDPSSGSNAPVFTSPACAQTTSARAARRAPASASTRIRPCRPASTTPCAPRRSRAAAARGRRERGASRRRRRGSAVRRASPFARRPSSALASTACRAAASAVKFAIVASGREADGARRRGSPSRSTSQPRHSSTTGAAGAATYSQAFWSQADVEPVGRHRGRHAPPMPSRGSGRRGGPRPARTGKCPTSLLDVDAAVAERRAFASRARRSPSRPRIDALERLVEVVSAARHAAGKCLCAPGPGRRRTPVQ